MKLQENVGNFSGAAVQGSSNTPIVGTLNNRKARFLAGKLPENEPAFPLKKIGLAALGTISLIATGYLISRLFETNVDSAIPASALDGPELSATGSLIEERSGRDAGISAEPNGNPAPESTRESSLTASDSEVCDQVAIANPDFPSDNFYSYIPPKNEFTLRPLAQNDNGQEQCAWTAPSGLKNRVAPPRLLSASPTLSSINQVAEESSELEKVTVLRSEPDPKSSTIFDKGYWLAYKTIMRRPHPDARRAAGAELLNQWQKSAADLAPRDDHWLEQRQCPLDEHAYFEQQMQFPKQEADLAYRDQWVQQEQCPSDLQDYFRYQKENGYFNNLDRSALRDLFGRDNDLSGTETRNLYNMLDDSIQDAANLFAGEDCLDQALMASQIRANARNYARYDRQAAWYERWGLYFRDLCTHGTDQLDVEYVLGKYGNPDNKTATCDAILNSAKKTNEHYNEAYGSSSPTATPPVSSASAQSDFLVLLPPIKLQRNLCVKAPG